MPFEYSPTAGTVLISVPHAGTAVPAGIAGTGQAWTDLPDTDWHVDRLMEFAPTTGAGLITARHSRYVIDLNRPPDDQPLYAQVGTGLVPTETFAAAALYEPEQLPGPGEKARRIDEYWQPYHQKLQQELDQIRDRHGYAVLLDAHSIASRVPRLFDGRLPDLNLGTYSGKSCAPELEQTVAPLLANADGFTSVVNGRFKGGFITRHYGQPEQGIHAMQLEIAQACYMDEAEPANWQPDRAQALQHLLQQLIGLLADWRPV
jgi:N-formylglutamate deformylase